MNEIEARIRAFLADESKVHMRHSTVNFNRNDFKDMVIRNQFVCKNGKTLSIQQGASHYCSGDDDVEVWYTQHSAFLEPYGTGEDPYAYVPIAILALHIAVLEGRDNNETESIKEQDS